MLSTAGIVAVIEPIDRIENPPIYLDGVSEAFEIANAVGSPNIRVLYDVYHEQREFGNLIEKFEKNMDQVGLIHIADVPGRHEPGTGEINYLNIYRKLAELNYRGTLAMEFYPTGDIVETLRRARDQARGTADLNFFASSQVPIARLFTGEKPTRQAAGESTECACISMLETRNTDAHKEERNLRKVIALLAGL